MGIGQIRLKKRISYSNHMHAWYHSSRHFEHRTLQMQVENEEIIYFLTQQTLILMLWLILGLKAENMKSKALEIWVLFISLMQFLCTWAEHHMHQTNHLLLMLTQHIHTIHAVNMLIYSKHPYKDIMTTLEWSMRFMHNDWNTQIRWLAFYIVG